MEDMEEGSDDNAMQEERGAASDSGGGRSRSAPPDTGAGLDHESDSEVEMFDIGLAASHSYLDAGMVSVRGRSVLEAGWQGRVPVMAHHGYVFPGETVPMVLSDPDDTALIVETIKRDRLFGLLCPDETGRGISGYGVLCEVYEAGVNRYSETTSTMSFKARANNRFRLVNMRKLSRAVTNYHKMRHMEVCVLPEIDSCDTLGAARLQSLDPLRVPRYRRGTRGLEVRERSLLARSMEATLTPWPRFLHDMFDYQRMRNTLEEYFKSVMMVKLPHGPVSLSFWVASNLVLTARDRLALFMVDNALLRLYIECHYVQRINVLCCTSCLTEISRQEHIFAMSSEGVHSNYVNLGGYMHDLVTVRAVTHVSLSGAPSPEYSWFPGYSWQVGTCDACGAHVGWRFVALKRTVRPLEFFGLCRNYIEPRNQQDLASRRSYLTRPTLDLDILDLIS